VIEATASSGLDNNIIRLIYVGALQHGGLQASGLTYGGRCFEQLTGEVDIKAASRVSAVPIGTA
jgi:hypothetical protein